MSPTSSSLLQQRDKPLPQPPSAQHDVSRTMKTVEEARDKIAELTDEVEQLKKAHNDDQERIENLTDKAEQLKERDTTDEQRMNDLTEEGIRLRLKYEGWKEQQHTILPLEMSDLVVEVIEVTGRNETLQTRNFDLERKAEMLRAEVERLVVDLAKNWNVAAAVELPENSSEGNDDEGGGKLGVMNLPKAREIDNKRSCEKGVTE